MALLLTALAVWCAVSVLAAVGWTLTARCVRAGARRELRRTQRRAVPVRRASVPAH